MRFGESSTSGKRSPCSERITTAIVIAHHQQAEDREEVAQVGADRVPHGAPPLE